MKRLCYFTISFMLITTSLVNANPCCPANYAPKQNPCCPNEQEEEQEQIGLSMMIWGLVMSLAVAALTGFVHNSGVIEKDTPPAYSPGTKTS